MRRLLIAEVALAAATLAGTASAQMRGGAGLVNPLSAPQTVTPGFASFGIPSPTSFPPRFHPHPFATGPIVFYSDLDYGYEPVAPPPPTIVVVQAPPPPAPLPPEQHASVEPLLLELQGDHWVRVDHFHPISVPVHVDSERGPERLQPAIPTVLVFRDGRREPVSSYAIIADSLYAHTDYWSTGAWTKKIPIADLDLAATMRANQERGIAFKLPAGPNEVVLQP